MSVSERMTTGDRVPARWVLVLVLVPLVAFLLLAAAVPRSGSIGWDEPVADAVTAIAPVSSEDVHLDPGIEAFTAAVALLTVVVSVTLLVRRRPGDALFLVAASGGSVFWSTLAKAIVAREAIEGPVGEHSFPSGSAAWFLATTLALTLVAWDHRSRRLLLVAGPALVVGYAGIIVFEEWHYPSDVLAAWCLALAWVAALWLALRVSAKAVLSRSARRRAAAGRRPADRG